LSMLALKGLVVHKSTFKVTSLNPNEQNKCDRRTTRKYHAIMIYKPLFTEC